LEQEEQPREIRLGPLIRVRGVFDSADSGNSPHWTIADVFVPEVPQRTLDNTRLAVCGSFQGRFELSLPPWFPKFLDS
jgi:hypothetical protein